MKLGLVSGFGGQIPPKGYGASEEVMWEVARRLSSDIKIGIFSKSASFFSKHSDPNIRFYYLNRFSSIADTLFFDRKLYAKFVLRKATKNNFNMLLTNNPLFVELLDVPDSKLIFHSHNAPGGGFEIDKSDAETKSKAFRMFEESEKILCVSEYVKRALLPYVDDKNKFHVILNGVDTKKFIPVKKENIVLCAGKIQPEKGQIYLLKAFSELDTDWKLLMTGFCSKPPYGELKYCEECYKYKSENIKFLGFKTREELIELYGKAKISVCPSIWQEPFGIVNIEAMSSGCATIATNVGGIPEIIKDGKTGFLVPPKDSDAIKEKLMMLMENENLQNKISKRAREDAVNRFDWDVIAKEYLRFYKSFE